MKEPIKKAKRQIRPPDKPAPVVKKMTKDDVRSVDGVKLHSRGWYHIKTPTVYYKTYIDCAIATHGAKER